MKLNYKEIKKLLNKFYNIATDDIATDNKPWWSDNDSAYAQSKAWSVEGYEVAEVKLGEYIVFAKK